MSPVTRRTALKQLAAAAGVLAESATFGADFFGGAAPANCPPPCEPACWDHWLIDAQDAPRCGDLCEGFRCLKYFRRGEGINDWIPVSHLQFYREMSSNLPVTFYLHGYNAHPIGAKWDSRFLGNSTAQLGVPFRLVSYIWPSQHVYGLGPMNNLDDKQQLGETHGGYVAEVIRHIHPAVPLSIVSHSYGAVPLAAALQTLAVTSTEEFDHPDHSNCRRSIQAAMLAGALGAYDFSPCGKFPLALSQLQRLAVTVNPSDKTLLLMNRIDRDDHIVGLMGLRDVPLAELPKISQWNIHSWVHRHHWLIWMLIHEQVAATLRPYFVNTLPRAFVEDVIPAELPVENVQPLPPAVPPREPPPKFK